MPKKTKRLHYIFGDKHIKYMRTSRCCTVNVAEGAVRAGKTVDNVFAFAYELDRTPDKIHLASGSTIANAKLNIGDCNGFGLEYIFRGRCKWGKYKGNECLEIKSKAGKKIVIFAGGSKSDSYKKIRGNSYGMWIATEINLHHDNTIKEAFNRQLAAKHIKVYWDLNPDNPNAKIYTEYIDAYAEKQKNGTFLGGYNYAHFTIHDNKTLPPERIKEIESRYDKNSIWYRRDIKGERCVAQGLIYRSYASDPAKYSIERKKLPEKFARINIGVDFGGNGSAHAFVATAFDESFRNVYVLASRRIPASGISVKKLLSEIERFCNYIFSEYGQLDCVYPDNAEQTIINSLKALLPYRVKNSLKAPIVDRIRCTDILFSSERLWLVNGQNEALSNAFKFAVWDEKHPDEDIRLDDGTSDIDTLDAFEYTIERHIRKFIKSYTKGKDE